VAQATSVSSETILPVVQLHGANPSHAIGLTQATVQQQRKVKTSLRVVRTLRGSLVYAE